MNAHYYSFLRECFEDSDINEHLPILFALASMSRVIVEFGVRSGRSTKAFLAGQSTGFRDTELYSFDVNDCSAAIQGQVGPPHGWFFTRADTSKLSEIPLCDLLLIDTLHTEEQVRAELRHGISVRKWIVLHDTDLFGENGEREQPGILGPIREFLAQNPHWTVVKRFRHNNGLMILEKTS